MQHHSVTALGALLLTAIGAGTACASDDTIPPDSGATGGRGGGTAARAGGAGRAQGGSSGAGTGGSSKGGRGGSSGAPAGGSAGKGGTGTASGGAGHGGRGGSAGAHQGGTGTGGRGGGMGVGATGGAAGEAGEAGHGQAGAGHGGASAGTTGTGASAGSGGDSAGAAGHAGQGGDGPGPNDKQAFAYVSRLLGGVVSLSLEASGTPRELASSPAARDHLPYVVVAAPSGRMLYTAEPIPGHLDGFVVAADGSIAKDPDFSLEVEGQPVTLTVEPGGHFLYAGMLDGTIHTFSLAADTGEPEPLGDPLTLAVPPAFLAADPTGRFLYESQEFAGGIRVYRIESSGALSELDDSPFVVDDVRQGAIVFTPDGAFLFNSGGGLNAFGVDPVSGALTRVDGSPFSHDLDSDFFAENIAVDPRGQYLYATSFNGSRHVTGFRIDASSGALEQVPGAVPLAPSPYSAGVDPAGRFLYVGNDSGDISVYAIDRGDGSLAELEASPFPLGGLQPSFAFVTR